MKKNKLFWAFAIIALPLGLISCGSDDNKDDDAIVYEFEEPVNKSSAARFTFESEDTDIQSVAFGESNSAVIQQQNEEGETEFVVGTYIKNGDTYIVSTSKGSYSFAFETQEDPSTGEQVVQATIKSPGQTEAVTAAATKTTTTNGGDIDLFRTWYPFKTVINLTKEGGTGTITDELDGIDFQALKERAEKENCHIKEDLTGWKVTSLFFQGTGEFGVNFTNGKSYYADWKWKGNNGDIDFDWKDKESIDNQFVNSGKAHAEVFKTGIYKGECWLSLSSEVEQDNGDKWNVEVIFRLTEKPVK